MAGMLDLWRRRSDPERVEAYTRWTLYILLGFIPLMALVMVAPVTVDLDGPRVGIATYVVLMVAQVALAIVVTRDGITAYRDGTPLPRRRVVLLLSLTAAAVVSAFLFLPAGREMVWEGRSPAVFLLLAAAIWALTLVVRPRVFMPLALVAGVVSALVGLPTTPWPYVVASAITYCFIMGTIAPSFRISVWLLGVVWEQHRTRQLHARLAVAEERLRFSRDLHDVLGRALSAIALKSELGAELARRGQTDSAAEQMLEVRELANDSLREVRAVVAGYRQADLETEIAGARSMLRSAGVRTRLVGEGTQLPPHVQSALAWVVREGATNVVRHARATSCAIDLAVVGQHARLTIVNDGATAAPSSGSGLVGLSERLARLGGTLATELRDGTFTLRAEVPLQPERDTVQPAAPAVGRMESP
ncbi:histidine kinase [uncultured Georgenia sp.]|uniref:sensor histidine kinase n=1 Tax=uncultured Georgenia sp. TaxID=378209 RepID=UPI00261855D6|nr:histidine kinase [uncultured Georgenia sp.]HLV04745.1 histidine kinase [Actinomycetaceae bacterium]